MKLPLVRILAAVLGLLLLCGAAPAASFALAPFSVDVTIPPGHPCMGGGIAPARAVVDPLYAKGFVLLGGEKPFVLVSLDWCEVRGRSYDHWREALAAAAGTEPAWVMLTSTHVHDAPVMDEEAEQLLREMEATGAWKTLPPPKPEARVQVASVCWPAFNAECIARVAGAIRQSVEHPRRITQLGTGLAKVEGVASNRRFTRADGTISYGRYSRSTDPEARTGEDGTIDPWLRTLSFWDGDKPVCAVHHYAVHPMSLYGQGQVSADFPGLARSMRESDQPGVAQIYVNGCAGNLTAGKYNPGDASARGLLAGRLHEAMAQAWANTKRFPLEHATLREAMLPLGARETPGYTTEGLHERLRSGEAPFERSEAAMGLSWYGRVAAGHRVAVPALDLGPARLLLLPAESYVEYQLYAESCVPRTFLMAIGYGECGPGYIPIERAWAEHDQNLHDWAWVPPGSEPVMKRAIRAALGVPEPAATVEK